MARSMGGISPMSLSADPSPKAPTTVWTETFDNGAPTYTGTNTGTLTNYVGIPPNAQTPAGAAGSGWNDIKNCVGIRLNHGVTLPNTALPLIGNDSYCGRVTGYAGLSLTLNRTTWWNVARGYANGLGGPTNNVASYISHANVTTSNIGAWNQTPVYETRGINFVSPSLGWDAAGRVQSRFYSGSFAAAASGTIGDQARLGMWLYPSGGPAARAANLFPTRVLPVTEGANAGTAPSPTPSGAAAVRAGTYTSTQNMLFQRSELQNFVLKITNDNGSSGGNDFAIDDVSLIDVTPSLHKEYVADNEQVYGASGQDKLARIRTGEDKTANLVFRITNTTDFQAKDGWGFTETLPAGLTADATGATFQGCGTNPTVTGSTTLVVSGGKLNAGSANSTCTVTVPVTADAFKKYSSAGTLPTGGGTGTSAMQGVYDPNDASIEFWQFDLGKEAFSGATDVNGASSGNEDARVNPGDTVTYTLELKNPSTSSSLVFGENLQGYPMAGSIWAGASVEDYLADVLDDADLLDSNGTPVVGADASGISVTIDGAPATPAPLQVSYSPGTPDGNIPAQPKITVTGQVPANKTAKVVFQVKVKPNNTDDESHSRLNGWNRGTSSDEVPNIVGYQLNNYATEIAVDGDGDAVTPLLPASCPPQTGFFSEQENACTRTQIRAWTIEKQSMPVDGEEVHSGGKVYYRVHITNISGDDWANVSITDNLTSALNKATWVKDPQAAWGIEFRDATGELIDYWPGYEPGGAAPVNPYETTLPTGALKTPIAIWPDFVCSAGSGAPADCANPGTGTESGNLPWTSAASWTLNVSGITIPAEAKTVVVGYIVRAGFAADPSDPTAAYLASGPSGTHTVPAPPGSVVANIVGGSSSLPSGSATPISPNRCAVGDLPGVGDYSGDPAGFSDCATSHKLAESFFHIRKHGVENGEIVSDVESTRLVIADTYEQAQAGVPSKWLCYANNSPCPGGEVINWEVPEQGTAPPGTGL